VYRAAAETELVAYITVDIEVFGLSCRGEEISAIQSVLVWFFRLSR
jgi:hypothetical protein